MNPENKFCNVNILLAEDNEINREVAIELLRFAGIKADYAENGRMAFERFAGSSENEYSVILMDLYMPEMNGFEAAKAIRGCSHPNAEIVPIIALTADDPADEAERCSEAGMDLCLTKPLDVDRLIDILKDLGIVN